MADIPGSSDRNGGAKPWGATIEAGPSDWQILQQDGQGQGRIEASGRWAPKESMGLLGAAGGWVEVRLMRQDTGVPVKAHLDWRRAETDADGRWRIDLRPVPAGGPYRLETRFNPKGNKLGEWSLRGDMRHFLGVGDLWIVAGQSNASGYGRKPYDDMPELGVHMLRQNGEWSLACHPLNDSTDTVFPASREIYNTGHSPFLHFARLLKRGLHHPIALLPAALGGSPLEAWHPERGPLFANLKAMVAAAGGRVKGMVWFQGESDAEPGRAGDYLERFLGSAEGWRRELAHPRLPILSVQLARHKSAHPHLEDLEWSQVREAQRQAALRGKGITVVPSLDLPLDDTIHIGTAGNMVLGGRLASCALGTVYGSEANAASPGRGEPDFLPPDLKEAVMESPQVVRLRFAPVMSRLDTLDPKAAPFRAEDDDGPIPLEKTVYFHRDSVKIFLKRAPRGQVRVSCGYGEDPDTLPLDVERQMPVLAFHAIAASE